jgi:hypothetical protein
VADEPVLALSEGHSRSSIGSQSGVLNSTSGRTPPTTQ